MSHLRIFLLLLGIVARQASAVNLLTLCRGQLSGTLLPNPHDCGTYYVCQSGPQLAYCGEGLHFDRVHKVCNWPERANCKLSEIEKEGEQSSHSEVTIKEDPTQDESNEVIVKPNNQDSVIQDESNEKIVQPGTSESGEKNLQQTIEEDSTQDEEHVDTIQPEEELDVEQTSSAKPIHLTTTVEPDNKKIDAHELEGLILSPVSKDPSSDDSAETGVASVEIDESVEKTPTHAIKLPVAVPGDKANVQISNSSKTSSSSPHNEVQFVQIAVSVLKPNQVQIEKEESLKPITEPANLSYEVFESSSSLEEEISLENVKPTIEVHMPVKGTPNAIVNGSNINVQAEEKLVSSKPSHSVSHIIAVHVPVHNIEIPNSIVNESSSNALAGVVEENAVPSKSSHNAGHTIEVHMPVHPTESSNSIVNTSISPAQAEGAMETVASSKPSRNVTSAIEVHMPVKGTLNAIVNGSSSDESAETGIASVEIDESVEKTPTHAIKLPVAVPGDKANVQISNSSKTSSSSPHNAVQFVQIPVSVLKPNQVQIEKEESLKPTKEPANLSYEVFESSSSLEEENTLENVKPTIEVHMPVKGTQNTIVNESNINALAEEKLISSKPSHSVSQITVHVPVHPIEVASSIVNAHNRTAQAELIVENVKDMKPTGTQVIELLEPALSVDAANSIELPDALIEKVEFSNQLNQVIELPAPADMTNTIVNAIDTIPQPGVVVEKVDSDEPTRGSGQVIELPAPALPAEVSNAIVNAVDAVNAVYDFSQAGAVVEKVGSGKPSGGSGQVIELPAGALPVEVSNPIVNAIDAVNAVYDFPQGGAVVEKVGSGRPTGGSGQVIELPAGTLPLVVSNAIANAVNAVNDLPQAEVVIEKVGSAKPTGGSGQVIELPAGTLPLDRIANAINAFPQAQAAVGSNNPSEVSNAFGNTDNIIPQVVKVDSGKPIQVIDLPVPAYPADISSAFAEHPAYEFQAGSLESKKSSEEESSNSESAEETVANVDSSEEDLALYLSSEEEQQKVDKSEESMDSSSLEDHQVISDADESSEEKIAEDTFDSQSLETEHLYQNQGKVDSLEEDQALTAAYESSKEELDQNNKESIEEILHSLEEDKQTTDSISSSEQNSVRPSSYRPNKQRPNDVEKVKRPTKKPSSYKPKPLGDRNVTKQSNSPTTSHNTVNSTNQQWNLTEAILSVAALEGITSANGTLIRPIVGAHDVKTGDPIDVMTDYNSKNVQCIHNGLYFLPHPSNCQKYFICAYRHLHLHSCGDNLIWNYKRERCELEFDSRCFSNETLVAEPKPGTATRPARDDKPDRTTAVTKGAPTSTPMPPLRTTYPSTLAVTETFDEDLPNCPSLRQAYLPSYDDCNKYYICILGHAVLTSCPDKLHWDAIGGFCGRPAKVRCASRVEKVSD